jgi:hypothetical protein
MVIRRSESLGGYATWVEVIEAAQRDALDSARTLFAHTPTSKRRRR